MARSLNKKDKIHNIIIQQYLIKVASKGLLNIGKRLFRMDACTLQLIDIEQEIAKYDVENEYYYDESYTVIIQSFNSASRIKATCSCSDYLETICTHRVAALLSLEKKLGYNTPPPKKYNQAHTVLKMSKISENIIHHNVSAENWTRARQLAKKKRAIITEGKEKNVTANIKFKGETHTVKIQLKKNNNLITSCTCSYTDNKLCLHKVVTLLQLHMYKGANAFDLMQDWAAHKNKLLSEYGFSLADDLAGKFDFKMGIKKPELVVLDPAILKLTELTKLGKQYEEISLLKKAQIAITTVDTKKMPIQPLKKRVKMGIGYVFQFNKVTYLPKFEIHIVTGELSSDSTYFVNNVSQLFIYKQGQRVAQKSLPPLDDDDVEIMQLIDELHYQAIANFAQSHWNIQLTHSWEHGGSHLLSPHDLNEQQKIGIQNYIQDRLVRIFNLLKNKRVFLQLKPPSLNLKTITPLNIATDKVGMHFNLKSDAHFASLEALLKIQDKHFPLQNVQLINNQILVRQNTIYLVTDRETCSAFDNFLKQPVIRINKTALSNLVKNILLPLQKKFSVDVDVDVALDIREENALPKAQIYLKESDDHMIILPVIQYNNHQVELDGRTEVVYQHQHQLIKITRDEEFEQNLALFLKNTHESFEEQYKKLEGRYFYISYEEVMLNLWFMSFVEQLNERGINLFGFKTLSKFHYNVNRPEIDIRVNSGIDWFNLTGDIKFGDQMASLRDVQKALIRKDRFIRLGDGTLGVLPDKWINKYASLFKMGDLRGRKLRLSKIHFSLVDELYDQIDDEAIQEELRDKRNKLLNFKEIANISPPKSLHATLRNYQREGFNWFNFLRDFNWGGCLADDMGLGKTLQVLTLLQQAKERFQEQENSEKQPHTSLVVAPTTLMFNWENEVQKFCPDLRIFRHHGTGRKRKDISHFGNYDIIITSYGILTSDIQVFQNFNFLYAILDESQAIKNPTTKRYKASRLLKAHYRIAMTGTPIENNTFDLYAQMNFLNPGMLGSMEFFKKEFANPIDKHGDETKVAALRKIVYPFILRRTKQMVATELPEKTETILYCEMTGRQREVYNAFRDNYRVKILEKIDKEGMSKAGMYILEGLMKLRQICDSPLLLKDTEDYGNDSVKLRELGKHITEQTGEHKILIFSQFLGMLQMIGNFLKKQKIPYTYLDGSTPAKDRAKAVKLFQETKKYRVFLISLKAGSLGLNLTAADYVYLVDPWWNPAVEQQAIDRTHRIGQTKKVFAYKMICKDSIEEKILNLQEKKRALAADLISTEKSFLKKLQREDVAFLFS